jgi:site-specific recombinase XerC
MSEAPDDEAARLARTPISSVLEPFLDAKAKGRTNDTGTYRRNLRRDVEGFLEFLEVEGVDRFGELTDRHCRRYARHLDGRDLADGTARTYYANVSAFLGWCAREGYLEANPATTERATEPLPDDDGRRSGDQQAWTPEQRRTVSDHLGAAAESALGDLADALAGEATAPPEPTARWEAIGRLRDRALVCLVGYAGIRGAELLSHPSDDRRNGLQWADVELSQARVTVLSKTQGPDDRAVPAQARDPLADYRDLLDPDPDWPVFVTLHRPSLYDRIRDRLGDRGVADDRIETLIEDCDPFEVFADRGIAPPALTTDGARRVLRRVTEAAGVEVDGDHEYLTLHGARRGAGEAMVRAEGYAAAARLLDDTERMVRERYSHIEAGELAAQATDAFDRVDDGRPD